MFKVKYKADNTLEKLKARLIAKGYNQEVGVDYFMTFSPVIKPSIMRTILTLARVKNCNIHQLDVKNVFLNGVLNEKVYIH